MTQEQQSIDLMAAVARVQRAVVVPKAKYNAFGKFSYRSYEDIVAALKEPCAKEGLAFFMTDELVQIGDRYYVKSTACVFPAEGGEGLLQVSACIYSTCQSGRGQHGLLATNSMYCGMLANW